jgi:hypothetical protein
MRYEEFKILEYTKPTLGNTFKLDIPDDRVGPAVADVQKVLLKLGYQLPKHGVDGIRGPETSAAVKQFQIDNNLKVDGDPGPETIGAMNKLIAGFPDRFVGLVKSTQADVKQVSGPAKDIDVSAIQDTDFKRKLAKVADALGVAPNDMLAIMKAESGVSPSKTNPNGGATGLIQFMPKTARSLGTTTDELRRMSAVDQLDYVYKYYKKVGVKPGMDAGDLYMATFYPALLGKPNSTIISRRGEQVYDMNRVLDRDRDGILTVADVKNQAYRFV